MQSRLVLSALLGSLLLMSESAEAQPADVLYDEERVPAYTLPDPLKFEDGDSVSRRRAWPRRRAEILRLFEQEIFGRSPGVPAKVLHVVTQPDTPALGGLALRREVTIYLTGDTHSNKARIDVLIYHPAAIQGPVPVILGLNFQGNAAIHPDPGIALSKRWMRNDAKTGITENRATEQTRGVQSKRWPVEMILKQGYAFATVYCGDMEPDHAEGWRDGVRSVFQVPAIPSGSEKPPALPADKPFELAPDAWGAIGAWAWGLSRVVDYFETDTRLDAGRVVLMGHSRLGKTALWAGAQDPRFAVVISNNSGAGGAALSRRTFGERTHHLNRSFPHWFNGNYKKYDQREADLPVDHHQLIALIAPRPAYVASAVEDRWADPRGEFLSCVHADPVYRLLGVSGLGTDKYPELNQPVGDLLRYHVRTGVHDVTDYDWEQYLDLANTAFKK